MLCRVSGRARLPMGLPMGSAESAGLCIHAASTRWQAPPNTARARNASLRAAMHQEFSTWGR